MVPDVPLFITQDNKWIYGSVLKINIKIYSNLTTFKIGSCQISPLNIVKNKYNNNDVSYSTLQTVYVVGVLGDTCMWRSVLLSANEPLNLLY